MRTEAEIAIFLKAKSEKRLFIIKSVGVFLFILIIILFNVFAHVRRVYIADQIKIENEEQSLAFYKKVVEEAEKEKSGCYYAGKSNTNSVFCDGYLATPEGLTALNNSKLEYDNNKNLKGIK